MHAPARLKAAAPEHQRDSAGTIIQLENIRKEFLVGGKRNTVFDGFSCSIEEGEFLSIIGPSGCGKSTLLRIVAGLDSPTAGSVIFNGKETSGPSKGMIYVFQQYTKSIFPWRTVIENVEFGIRSQKRLSRKEAREKCMEFIRLVGLEGHENYYPAQLSGGMQQRVVIARALVCEPRVLLMDEPFSAVDAMTRAILQELILMIWERLPITVLFVTHDVDEAVFLSRRIISLGRAPASIKEDVQVELHYPRDQIKTRGHPQFTAVRQKLFASIFLQERGDAPQLSAEVKREDGP